MTRGAMHHVGLKVRHDQNEIWNLGQPPERVTANDGQTLEQARNSADRLPDTCAGFEGVTYRRWTRRGRARAPAQRPFGTPDLLHVQKNRLPPRPRRRRDQVRLLERRRLGACCRTGHGAKRGGLPQLPARSPSWRPTGCAAAPA